MFVYVSYFRLVHSSFFNFPLMQTLILWLEFSSFFFSFSTTFLNILQNSLFIIPYYIYPFRDLEKSTIAVSCSVFPHKHILFLTLGLDFWYSHLRKKKRYSEFSFALIVTSGKMGTFSKSPFKYVVLSLSVFQFYFLWFFFSIYSAVDLKSTL